MDKWNEHMEAAIKPSKPKLSEAHQTNLDISDFEMKLPLSPQPRAIFAGGILDEPRTYSFKNPWDAPRYLRRRSEV